MLIGSVVISGEPWDRRSVSFLPPRPFKHDAQVPLQAVKSPMAELVGCLVELRLVDGTTATHKVLAVEPPMLKIGPDEWIGLASILSLKKVGFSDAELADLKAIGLTLDDFQGDPRHDAHRK